MSEFEIETKIWKYGGKGAWYFATIDKETSDNIKQFNVWKRGWGSIPVNVTVGKTTWETSIFPDKDGVYLLPIKKSVRSQESLVEDDTITLKLSIRD